MVQVLALRGAFKNLSLYAVWQRIFSQPCIVSFTHATVFLPLQSHPGGLLFTKFGSNQTALLDLAFPVTLSLPFLFVFFSIVVTDIFFMSCHSHSFIVYMGVCGSFIHV